MDVVYSYLYELEVDGFDFAQFKISSNQRKMIKESLYTMFTVYFNSMQQMKQSLMEAAKINADSLLDCCSSLEQIIKQQFEDDIGKITRRVNNSCFMLSKINQLKIESPGNAQIPADELLTAARLNDDGVIRKSDKENTMRINEKMNEENVPDVNNKKLALNLELIQNRPLIGQVASLFDKNEVETSPKAVEEVPKQEIKRDSLLPVRSKKYQLLPASLQQSNTQIPLKKIRKTNPIPHANLSLPESPPHEPSTSKTLSQTHMAYHMAKSPDGEPASIDLISMGEFVDPSKLGVHLTVNYKMVQSPCAGMMWLHSDSYSFLVQSDPPRQLIKKEANNNVIEKRVLYSLMIENLTVKIYADLVYQYLAFTFAHHHFEKLVDLLKPIITTWSKYLVIATPTQIVMYDSQKAQSAMRMNIYTAQELNEMKNSVFGNNQYTYDYNLADYCIFEQYLYSVSADGSRLAKLQLSSLLGSSPKVLVAEELSKADLRYPHYKIQYCGDQVIVAAGRTLRNYTDSNLSSIGYIQFSVNILSITQVSSNNSWPLLAVLFEDSSIAVLAAANGKLKETMRNCFLADSGTITGLYCYADNHILIYGLNNLQRAVQVNVKLTH